MFFRSTRVKIHNITPATDKERGDVEIRDYVVFQKPRDLTGCLPPPATLILDFTLTHTRFGRSQLSSLGQLTHTRRTDGAPEPDGALRTVTRAKIHHYRQLYINRPEPITFMPVTVDTAGRIYEDFSRLLFVGLILAKASVMRISIPFDLSSRRFIPLPCFIRSRRASSFLLGDLPKGHMWGVFHIRYIGFS
jgi:hypothetical protein